MSLMRLMRFLPATAIARRAISSPAWIYSSYRGIRRLTSSTAHPAAYLSAENTLSPASQTLRSKGPRRTRFAPSPTGLLHLGSLRTALFNYLVAKATGGQFLLRIEDTDQKRTIKDAEESLYKDLEWAGLEWDEGPKVGGPYGPYHQSQRTAIYREHAEKLLQSGHAYRCFCTPERLHTLAEHRSRLGLPPDYDRTCAYISKEESDDRASHGESHVVRFKAPEQYPVYHDLVYGKVAQRKPKQDPGESYDDAILLKSDGFPTYHLANVVDDHLMKITTVIRGSEWMSSTHKHLAMYNAFGWQPPEFAHVGLLLDEHRQKLSKRAGAVHIKEYRDQGIFPETLMNFVALLGWSHAQKSDVMDMKELINQASMKYTKGDTVVPFQKLPFLQKKHVARYAALPPNMPKEPSHDLKELAVKPMMKILEGLSSDSLLSTYQRVGLRAAPMFASRPPEDIMNRYATINGFQSQLTQEIDSYEVTVRERDAVIHGLQDQVEVLKSAPAAVKAQRIELLKSLQSQVATLLGEHTELLAKIDTLVEEQHEVADAAGLNEHLTVATRSCEVRIIQRDAAISEIKTQVNKLETAIAEDITMRHTKLQGLQRQLSTLSNEHSALLGQLIALEEQHTQLEQDLSINAPSGISQEDYIHSIVVADSNNYVYPDDFIDHSRYFFRPPSLEELRAAIPFRQFETNLPRSETDFQTPETDFFQLLQKIVDTPNSDWTADVLKHKMKEMITAIGSNKKQLRTGPAKQVHEYLRWAIMATRPGPDMADVMAILGKEETMRRLELAQPIAESEPEVELSAMTQRRGVAAGAMP